MSLTVQIIILAILILLSAFFSGIETALMSLGKVKIKALLRQKKKGAEALSRIKQNPHRLLITILVFNNLVNIGAASLATVLFTDLFGSSGAGIATGVMTFFILVFGEISPKTLASQNAEKISLRVARPVEILSTVISPVISIFEGISMSISKILGSEKEKEFSEDEIKTIVSIGAEEGLLNREAAKMMKNILEFRGRKVTQVMTPDADIEMIDGEKKLKDVINFLIKKPYSKYPVFLENKDKISGVLDIEDILKYVKEDNLNVKVKKVAREPYFVPESKDIGDLLTELSKRKMHMAIVVNEYGDVSGLVTMEDILEEIVGDIFDKSNRDSLHIKKVDGKYIRVDAKASVEEVNKVLALGLEEEKFNTIAGFIENKLQKIPKKGDKVKLNNVTIEVGKASKQGVESIRVIKN